MSMSGHATVHHDHLHHGRSDTAVHHDHHHGRHGTSSELQHLRNIVQYEHRNDPIDNGASRNGTRRNSAGHAADAGGKGWDTRQQHRLETASQRSETHPNPIRTETGIARIQRYARTAMNKRRLHRKNLAERLLFEANILKQTIRLMNQIMVFGLFIGALRMSSKEVEKRGIFTTMDAHFDFAGLQEIKLKEEFMKVAVPQIADTSKQFFLHSTRYFDDTSSSGAVRILQEPAQFSRPLVGNEFNLGVRNFTFVAWVKTQSAFVDGYIFRKRPGNSEQNKDLACWGFALHKNNGPGLHYGAHDFFSTGQEFVHGTQFEVSAVADLNEVKFPPEESAMLTMTVTPTKVQFYRNLEKIYEATLPVPVSDCGNDGEGLLLGSRDIEISQLTFYPKVLGPSFIEEIYASGALLSDIATGSSPTQAAVTELQSVGNTLTSGIRGVESNINDRQDLTEVGLALAEVAQQSNPDTSSPTAPLGKMDMPFGAGPNASSHRVDPDIGHEYHLLLEGPYKLTATSDNDAETRSVVALPSFRGTGMTLSFWYRHIPCPKQSCGLYLFSASPPGAEGDLCWTLWLENDAVWTDVVASETPGVDNHYPRGFVDKAFWLDGVTTWRHLAWVFDETTDHFKWFVDGVEAINEFYGKPVSKADCEGPTSLALGRIGPGYKLGAEVELYDVRIFVHSNGSPLSNEDIYKLAFPSYPLAIEDRHRCMSISDPRLEDTQYRDAFGNGCEWYYKMKSVFPEVCNHIEVAEKCPKACGTIQQCNEPKATAQTYYTWSSIRRIESRHPNGTICLGSRYNKAAIVDECKAWTAGGGPDTSDIRHWLDASTQQARLKVESRKLDIRNCEALEMAIDEHCSFDSDQVAAFSQDIMASGGDWTIGVWVKPTGLESKYDTGDGVFRFFPTFGLLSSISPPTNNIAWGKYVNPNGEVKLYSACDETDTDVSENVENRPAGDDWTFLAISRTSIPNAAPDASVKGSWYVATNEAKDAEPSAMRVCPFNELEFFVALEINYPVVMSPIMMIPRALAFAEAQQHYLDNSDFMQVRNGPKSSRAQQVEDDKVEISKTLFQSKSVLMAPPILFQSKVKDSANCSFKYSKSLLQSEHQKALDEQCAEPFECEIDFFESPAKLMSCGGDPIEEDKVYDLEPYVFNGRIGFSDFLFSISDSPFLMRNTSRGNRLITPDEFMGDGTELLEIFLVFYTPDTGTTSVLSISADFSQPVSAEVEILFQHITILEGSMLIQYIFTQAMVCVFVMFMIIDAIKSIGHLYRLYKKEHLSDMVLVVKVLVDLATAIMIIVFIGIRIPYIVDSAAETERIVGGLASIPWSSSEIDVSTKKEQFYSRISELQDLMAYEEVQGTFCNVIIILNLIRVIQCTGLHPRLAILTSTLVKSADDLWHCAMLVLLLMCCFAGLGTWRFGAHMEIFSTIERTLQTEFEMTFGEFPVGWTESRELQFFVVSYLIIVFVLVQNFVLAIIVEAYMSVRQEVIDLETEQEFLSDIVASVTVHWYQWWRGWPDIKKLGKELELWMCKYSVGFRDLYQTGLFPTQLSAVQFLRWYSQYDFCTPENVGDFSPTQDKEEALVQRIEKTIANLFGIQARTLKQVALESAMEKERRMAEKEGRDMDMSSLTSKSNNNSNFRHNPLLGRQGSHVATSPIGGRSHVPTSPMGASAQPVLMHSISGTSSLDDREYTQMESLKKTLQHKEELLEQQAGMLKNEEKMLEYLTAESTRQGELLNQLVSVLANGGVTLPHNAEKDKLSLDAIDEILPTDVIDEILPTEQESKSPSVAETRDPEMKVLDNGHNGVSANSLVEERKGTGASFPQANIAMQRPGITADVVYRRGMD